MKQPKKKTESPAPRPTEARRPYSKPRITYREPLEAIANVCGKADVGSCPATSGLSS